MPVIVVIILPLCIIIYTDDSTLSQTKQQGFDCSFTSSQNPLICCQCKHILRKPHTLQCCKQNFCEFCISQIQQKGDRCSRCNSNIVHHPNKELEGVLLQFEVHCTHKCGWKGPLLEHDSHMNSDPIDGKWLEGCKEVEVQCIYCRKKSIKHKHLLQRLEYRFHKSKVNSVNNITCCVSVCAKWYDIGIELGLSNKVLLTIRLLHLQTKPEECYHDMLKEWIGLSECANWKSLLEGFRKLNFKSHAKKIEQGMTLLITCLNFRITESRIKTSSLPVLKSKFLLHVFVMAWVHAILKIHIQFSPQHTLRHVSPLGIKYRLT